MQEVPVVQWKLISVKAVWAGHSCCSKRRSLAQDLSALMQQRAAPLWKTDVLWQLPSAARAGAETPEQLWILE